MGGPDAVSFVSEVLRLPKEPNAERDGWASTWLPAIYPADSGEGVTLRSLGMKPRRWGGERSVGLGRDSDARSCAVGNLLSPAGRPLFARFDGRGQSHFRRPRLRRGARENWDSPPCRHFRGSERRRRKTPKGLLLSAAGNHRTCPCLDPSWIADAVRVPMCGSRRDAR